MVNQNFMPLMLITCQMNASLQTRGHLNSPKIGSQGLRDEQFFSNSQLVCRDLAKTSLACLFTLSDIR